MAEACLKVNKARSMESSSPVSLANKSTKRISGEDIMPTSNTKRRSSSKSANGSNKSKFEPNTLNQKSLEMESTNLIETVDTNKPTVGLKEDKIECLRDEMTQMSKMYEQSFAQLTKLITDSMNRVDDSPIREKRYHDEMSSDSDTESLILTQKRFKPMQPEVDVVDQINELLKETSDEIPMKTADTDKSREPIDIEYDLEQEYIFKDKTDKDINPKLVNIINQFFACKMPEDKVTEILEKYNRPGNLDVHHQKVNKEIWSNLKPPTRSKDIKYQKAGEKILKSAYCVTKLVDKLLDLKKGDNSKNSIDWSELIKLGMDGLSILGLSLQDVNQNRRESMKSDLNVKFRQLCNQSNNNDVGPSQLLFGDDLNKRIKDLKDTNQVSYNVSGNNYPSSSNTRYGYKGASRPSYYPKGKGFLYQGNARPRRPPYYQYHYQNQYKRNYDSQGGKSYFKPFKGKNQTNEKK